MIPNANNITNFNNQIKIQLTTDNKCLIQALSESPIKSQNTMQKEDFSINDDMSLSKSDNSIDNNNNIINNSQNQSKPIILNSNKKNSNNDFDSNSNLLISFSNISEVTKINNNDNSLIRINSNKNNSIIMNKEKDFVKNNNNDITCDKNLTINNIANFEGNSIFSNNNFLISNEQNKKLDSIKTPMRNGIQNNNIANKNKTSNKKKVNSKKLLNQFNKNDLSEMSCGIINLNLNNVDDKSENYDKVNFVYSDKKSDENSLKLNNNSNKNIIGNKNKNKQIDKNNSSNKKENVKCFKNCTVQKNEDINIIQIKTNKEKTIDSHQDSVKKNQDNIIPNHCTNFSFCGIIKNNKNLKELDINSFKDFDRGQNSANLNLFQNQINTHTINNTNTLDINDDYVSPTFNLNLNYNSLDKNYNNSNTLDIESSKEKDILPDSYAVNKVNTNNNISIKNYNNLINNKDSNNINIKKKNDKNKKEIMTRKINNNNLKNQLMLNKPNKLNTEQSKTYTIKTQEKNISITTNSNSNTNTKSIKDKENRELEPKLSLKQKVMSNNNYQNFNNILNNINLNLNDKNGIKIINNKNKQNSRYRHPNADSVHFNYDKILKNLNNSMTESEHKKKLSISSHTKSKSGTGSLIKFQGLHNNIFNIKNGTFIKTTNNCSKAKKFKSISPKIQRRNLNSGCLKLKCKNKSKSQNRSKTNSKSKNKNGNNIDKNQINLLMKNKKSNCYGLNNISTSKPLTLQEKMDIILSKNIIALTKKLRKSPSPKMKVSRPSLIKNIIVNSQGKIVDNLRGNNFINNNNVIHNNVHSHSKSKKKSPSPIHFKILSGNNGNYVYSLCNTNANQSSHNKKSIMYFNNNINNYINDNLLLVNNHDIVKKKLGKKLGNSPKNIDENNNYLNQKKSLQIYDNININSNYQRVKNNKNIKPVSKKGLNLNKFEEDFKKRQYIQKNKNLLMKDINKKNNIIIINNIKINNNNNNNNKKNMTIIQNFSKYKKKAEVNNLVNMNTKNNRKNCYNENVSNNYPCLRKNANEEKHYKKINMNLNINHIANKIIEDKKKKIVYNTSLHKKTDQDDDFDTN